MVQASALSQRRAGNAKPEILQLARSRGAERRNTRPFAEALRPLPTSGDMGAAFGRAGAHQVALESGQAALACPRKSGFGSSPIACSHLTTRV